MFGRLLPWYERELSFLKREAALFAREYPHRARRLGLQEHDVENPDPHVERLIQAVALLSARLRMQIEDDFPQLSDTFLELMLPDHLAPVPSFSVVEFQLDPEQAQVTTRHPVPRGRELRTRPVDGTACRYRTCYDVDVWPLAVESVSVESPARTLPRRGPRTGVVSAVRIGFSCPVGPIGELGLDRLRLHFHGTPAVAYGLHELLLRSALHVELTGRDSAGREDVVLPLRPADLRPVGFAPEDGLFPYSMRSFLGFRLLQEYFALPEKFLFVDVLGLEATRGALGPSMELIVYCRTAPPFDETTNASNVRLGCTPVVNLFEVTAEPVRVDHRQDEYHVIPSVAQRGAVEPWAVTGVTASSPEAGGTPPRVAPLFAFGHGGVEGSAFLWQARRKDAPDGVRQLWLALALPDDRRVELSPLVLSVRLLCTNGQLPARLRTGGDPKGDMLLDGMPGFLRIVSVRQPTRPLRPARPLGSHWRLIAHMGLNYASLVEGDGSALRSLLELYEPTNTEAARAQIQAIVGLRSDPADRLLDGSVVRGTRVALRVDGTAFRGTGHYLFATVLDRFLAMYAAVNSFTQLSVTTLEEPETRLDFPPRAGQEVLL